ncbi:hypothetical protein BC938DRAFT_474796 [Jimgerdemannia flammicorona]|uniref:Uncharacterized protein n=1 Tax=Jimgerdemannia flammicorona TaxID=994334 RepID=A0A433Q1P1_9FUNG|nr:hypothetical protein BC938DRAFT_474796 [Jimgerdemannia flammicorona]
MFRSCPTPHERGIEVREHFVLLAGHSHHIVLLLEGLDGRVKRRGGPGCGDDHDARVVVVRVGYAVVLAKVVA